MIEFEKRYSTPRAQRQFELEQLIKHYEMQHAANISHVMKSVATGLGYVLLMGVFIGYGSFDDGYAVAIFLAVATAGLLIGSKLLTEHVKRSNPNLNKPEVWIKR